MAKELKVPPPSQPSFVHYLRLLRHSPDFESRHVSSISSDPSLLASTATGTCCRGSSARASFEELGLDLSMTECAMAKLERSEGRLERLMLAYLAGVVLLGEDTLA